MSGSPLPVIVSAIGAVLSLATIVFLAGVLKGSVATRLDNIEARLNEIEHAMRRGGFTIRKVSDD